MLEKIKNDLPNFPDDVIQDWILPYTATYGWPPTDYRWEGVLFSRSLDFWKRVKWTKKKLNLLEIKFGPITRDINDQLKKAYIFKEENLYSEIENGKQRYMNALYYLLQNGVLPKPICLLREDEGYSVVDGSHRMLAFSIYETMARVEKNVVNKEDKAKVVSFKETIKKKCGVDNPKEFSPTQEVWVASLD